MFVRILLIAGIAVLVWSAVARTSQAHGAKQVVRVQAYDTLWSIAQQHYGGDVRDAIWRIQQANHLQGANVRVARRSSCPSRAPHVIRRRGARSARIAGPWTSTSSSSAPRAVRRRPRVRRQRCSSAGAASACSSTARRHPAPADALGRRPARPRADLPHPLPRRPLPRPAGDAEDVPAATARAAADGLRAARAPRSLRRAAPGLRQALVPAGARRGADGRGARPRRLPDPRLPRASRGLGGRLRTRRARPAGALRQRHRGRARDPDRARARRLAARRVDHAARRPRPDARRRPRAAAARPPRRHPGRHGARRDSAGARRRGRRARARGQLQRRGARARGGHPALDGDARPPRSPGTPACACWR